MSLINKVDLCFGCAQLYAKTLEKSETRPWLKIFRFSQVWTEKPATSSSKTRPDPDPNLGGLAFFLRFLGFPKIPVKKHYAHIITTGISGFSVLLTALTYQISLNGKQFMATILSNLPKMATFLLLKVFSQKLFEGKVYKRRNYSWIYNFYGEWANKV